MTARKSCCRRAAVGVPTARDFCEAVTISTGVTLVLNNGGWELLVMTPGGQVMNLADAIVQYNCKVKPQTAGLRLSEVVLAALAKVVASGAIEGLKPRANRQVPLITMKELLFAATTKCPQCKGSGCATCNKTGLAP